MVGQNFERFRLVSHVLRFLSDNLYLVNDLLTLRDSLSYLGKVFRSPLIEGGVRNAVNTTVAGT